MSRPNLRSVAAVVAFGIVTLRASVAPADQNSLVAGDGGSAHVVNGVTTGFYPAVGALLLGDAEHGRAWCSGTLIDCQTFLTAAHCVCPTDGATCTNFERPNPSAYTVFFQDAGFVAVDAITVHPDFSFPRADLAVIRLSQPVTRVRPIALNTDASPAPESSATIVGFGNSGGGNMDFGIKRSGRVVVADGMVGQGDGLVGWHFRGPMGDPGSNANTCSGDSGGPLLLESHSGWTLVGTTTGGQNGLCLTDDVSIDTDVFMYRDWIRDVTADDGTCAAPIDETLIRRSTAEGVVGDDTPTVVHTVDVPAGATQLLVTMNGVDDGRSRFTIDVRGPQPSSGHCDSSGSSQFAVCELNMPDTGAWQIQVERVFGDGPYQINAIAFSQDCSRPESEGEACNDGDACTANDVCAAGQCVGSPVASDNPACGPRTCSPAPLPDCASSAARQHPLLTWPSRLVGRPSFTWRWMRPTRAAEPQYGDPTTDADYAFCVYADIDNATPLLLAAPLHAGDGWLAYRRGFSYLGDASDGARVSHARVRTDRRARTTIVVKGEGSNPLARIARLRRDLHVRAQLQGRSGCWETTQMLTRNPASR